MTETVTATKNPSFVRSIDTQLLVDRLIKTTVGETLSYADLSAIIKRDVTNGARGALMSACRIATTEHGIVFGTIRGHGIKRLNDSETIDMAAGSVTRIHREARRGARRIATVAYDKLTPDGQLKHNCTATILAVLNETTGAKTAKRIEGAVEKSHSRLSLNDTLAALSAK